MSNFNYLDNMKSSIWFLKRSDDDYKKKIRKKLKGLKYGINWSQIPYNDGDDKPHFLDGMEMYLKGNLEHFHVVYQVHEVNDSQNPEWDNKEEWIIGIWFKTEEDRKWFWKEWLEFVAEQNNLDFWPMEEYIEWRKAKYARLYE